jgi:hypothetical protein
MFANVSATAAACLHHVCAAFCASCLAYYLQSLTLAAAVTLGQWSLLELLLSSMVTPAVTIKNSSSSCSDH